MKEITTVGVDLAKSVFTVHGVDAADTPIASQAVSWPTNELGPHARLVMVARAQMHIALIRGRLEICSLSYQRSARALAKGKSLEN